MAKTNTSAHLYLLTLQLQPQLQLYRWLLKHTVIRQLASQLFNAY